MSYRGEEVSGRRCYTWGTKARAKISESRRKLVSEKLRGGRIGWGWETICRVLELSRVPTSSRFIDEGMDLVFTLRAMGVRGHLEVDIV